MPINIWGTNIKEVYIGGQKAIMAFIWDKKVYSSYHLHWEFDDYSDITSIYSQNKWSNKIAVKNGKLQVKSDGNYVEGTMSYIFKRRDIISIKCQLNTTDEQSYSDIVLYNSYNNKIAALGSNGYRYPRIRCGTNTMAFPQIPLSTPLILTIKINDSSYEVILKKEDGQEIMRDSSNKYMQWDFSLQFSNSNSNTMLIDYIRLNR